MFWLLIVYTNVPKSQTDLAMSTVKTEFNIKYFEAIGLLVPDPCD